MPHVEVLPGQQCHVTALYDGGNFILGRCDNQPSRMIRAHQPSSEDIPSLSATIGLEIPDWFAEHFLRLSGLRSDTVTGPVFSVTYPDGTASNDFVTHFLSVDQIADQWPHIGYLAEFMDHFELDDDFFQPELVVPMADTAAGTVYVSLSGSHAGAVFYSDNGDFGIARLADSIPEFLQALEPSILPTP